jgi:hypothetical protein
MAAWVASRATGCTELTVEGDRGFESISLHQRVRCEPDLLDQGCACGRCTPQLGTRTVPSSDVLTLGDITAKVPNAIALDHLLHLARQFVSRNEDGDLRSDTRIRDIAQPPAMKTVHLVVGSPLHSLLCFAETGRAFDEQMPRGLSVLGSQPPEEEPLDDLAQPLLGFLGREAGGAGSWRHGWKRAGVARVAGEPCASDCIGRNASGSRAA